MAFGLGAQAVNASPASTATTHAVTLTTSAADLVVICVSCRDDTAGASSCVGSVNGAYTRAGATQGNVGIGSFAEIWYFENSGAGTETVTVTFGGSVRAGLNGSRWTGGATSSALDQNNGADNGAGTSHSHGSITTTAAGLIVTCLAGSGDVITGTSQTDFTALTNNTGAGYDRSYYGYRIVASSTTTTGTVTTGGSVQSSGKIASFNEAAGAAYNAVPTIYASRHRKGGLFR